jgi:signal transduction histidine kinase
VGGEEIHILRGDDTMGVVSVSSAPIRDREGRIVAGVTVFYDITERRQLEQRTREALEGLLKLAELLVSIPQDIYADAPHRSPSGMLSEESRVGKQLVELTCSIVGCQRASITAVNPDTHELRSVAIAGVLPEQEYEWRERRPGSYLSQMFQDDPAALSNQVNLIDMTQPPYCDYPNPYGIQTMLVAPMTIADEVVGILVLDHGSGVRHEYTEEERALTGTIAKLAALVIERERLLQERAEAKANELSLRETNRRMDEFLSIVSHELRSPLTSIKGNIQLAQRRLKALMDGDRHIDEDRNKLEVAQALLERAERQARVLNRLVNDLVDISRIQAGKLDLQVHPYLCDLASIVREAVQEQRTLHPERTIRFELSPQESVPVIADADRIGQVVTNYLTNALKYSPSDSAVDVALQVEESMVRVCVHDEGSGLSPLDQERIWERFYQAENVEVQSGASGGLGLGLYISKAIIEQHHGQVGVQSCPSSGTTFWFTLPQRL